MADHNYEALQQSHYIETPRGFLKPHSKVAIAKPLGALQCPLVRLPGALKSPLFMYKAPRNFAKPPLYGGLWRIPVSVGKKDWNMIVYIWSPICECKTTRDFVKLPLYLQSS